METRRGVFRTPYELVIDYRDWPTDMNWGEVEFVEDFQFPTELSEHKEKMIHSFTKDKLLKGGNNPCPRISKMEIQTSNVPLFYIQKAWYYDQVGTNLSLDYPFYDSVIVDGYDQFNVRSWDIAQSGSHTGVLPDFESSRLANTIGVAVGITVDFNDGRSTIIMRKRSKEVAVYPNMWHLPFTFALSLESYPIGNRSELEKIIQFDIGHEQAEELGLDPSDLGPLKPIAFCRDLVRGGKPQFFFEKHSKISFEELQKRTKELTNNKEYKGKIKDLSNTAIGSINYSPELACFLVLKSLNL